MSRAKQIIISEEGMSPVMGAILMVAITLILAAVIAAFVFGFGTPEPTPVASVQGRDAINNITLQHTGGDVIDLTRTSLIVIQRNNILKYTKINKSGAVFGPGDVLEINTSVANGILLNGVTCADNGVTNNGYFTLEPGEVTVTLIDISSGQILTDMEKHVVKPATPSPPVPPRPTF